jgi:hypothetical protein
MATGKKKTRRPSAADNVSLDGVYLLKLLLYVLLGSLWLKVSHGQTISLALPVGFVIGLIFAAHEHFRLDRKIEYAVLFVALLIGYIAPYGLYISF